ncbi:MAG: hypothetical protein KAH01_02325 [Caldisericia bacterium]|nr:hypothetical protein [Caldisericia bacterium]
MKQLFGHNVLIVLFSLIVVLVVLSFTLNPKNRYQQVNELPFISVSKAAGANEAFKNLWNTKNATIEFSQNPMFSLDKITQKFLVWDGKKDLLIVAPSSNEMSDAKLQDKSLLITCKNPQTWLSINRVIRSGLYIEVMISDHSNKEATMSYYGEKEDKFTLHPELESYQNAVLIRPIDAIEIESTLLVYFEFAWIENGSDLRFGLLEYSWDGESLLWKVISDNIGFKETGKGSSAIICQDKAWFILLDGSVRSIDIKNGKQKVRDDISSKLTTDAKTSTKAYRYKNALIIHSVEESGNCSILFVENNRISGSIYSDKKTVACYRDNKKSMYYDYQAGHLDPCTWIFPTY